MNYPENGNGSPMNPNGYNGLNYSNHSQYDDKSADTQIELLKILNILFQNKWILVAFVTLFTSVAIIIALTMPPVYRSEGSIIISESKNRYSYAGADLSNLLTTTYGIGMGSTIANELQILRSRILSEELADSLLARKYLSNGVKFPILWRVYPTDSTTTSRDTIAYRIQTTLTETQVDPEADLVRLGFESPLPEEAAYIVNLTIDTYSKISTDQNRDMASKALSFLSEQRDDIEVRLAQTEESLRIFMNESGLITIDQQSEELIETLSTLESDKQKFEVQLVATESAIFAFKSQLNEIKPGLAQQFSEGLAPIIERYQYELAELETEKLLLLSKNPELRNQESNNPELSRINAQIIEVRNQIQNVTSRLVDSRSDLYLSFINNRSGSIVERISNISQQLIELDIQKTQYSTQIEVLEDRINELNSLFEELPDDIIRLAQLKRDVAVNERLYILVSNQYAEMSLWEQTQFGLGRPLDYAQVPKEKVKPRRKLIVIVGMFLGGVFGVGFILLKDTIDDTIKSSESLKQFNVPFLGAIPDFSITDGLDSTGHQFVDKKTISNQLVTFLDHISPISEAYRRLRINIVYANPDKDNKVMMVTSATKGEGKSTVASNLAVTFSEAEKSVLIIDLDLRRPTQHKVFGENREPGLTETLFDTVRLSDIINTTIAPNVDLLTVGKKTPEPATVLDSKRLKQLIDKLKDRYDHIILDTAPYGIISDSASLLRLIDGLIIVSRFNTTTKRELQFTIDGLKHLNADIVGIVLNAFNPEKSTDYYTNYSYYKRTYYSEYYKDEN